MKKSILIVITSLLSFGCSNSDNLVMSLEPVMLKSEISNIENTDICFSNLSDFKEKDSYTYRTKIKCDKIKTEFKVIHDLSHNNMILIDGFERVKTENIVSVETDSFNMAETEYNFVKSTLSETKVTFNYVGLYYSLKDKTCYLMDNYKGERKTQINCDDY